MACTSFKCQRKLCTRSLKFKLKTVSRRQKRSLLSDDDLKSFTSLILSGLTLVERDVPPRKFGQRKQSSGTFPDRPSKTLQALHVLSRCCRRLVTTSVCRVCRVCPSDRPTDERGSKRPRDGRTLVHKTDIRQVYTPRRQFTHPLRLAGEEPDISVCVCSVCRTKQQDLFDSLLP